MNQWRTKLDDKSAKYIFIGDDVRSKVYKLFDLNIFKLYVSRDVKFDEECIWNWNINMKEIKEDEEA